jgi:single-strand DNA-binding protein
MANFNKVILMGNLTRDVELRHTQGGHGPREVRHGDQSQVVNRTASQKESTCFVDLTAWGKPGRAAEPVCAKGSQLFVEGRLEYSTWESQEGGKRSKLEVVVENFQFVGSAAARAVVGGGGGGGGGGRTPQRRWWRGASARERRRKVQAVATSTTATSRSELGARLAPRSRRNFTNTRDGTRPANVAAGEGRECRGGHAGRRSGNASGSRIRCGVPCAASTTAKVLLEVVLRQRIPVRCVALRLPGVSGA